MPILDGTETHFYPSNPHIKTRTEVQNAEMFAPTYQAASGTAPILTIAVEKTHPIVPRWRDVCEQTIDILKKAEISWTAIECFQRRQLPKKEDNFDDTTVVITVNGIPSRTNELRAVLDEIHELSGGLFVELIRGRIWPHYSEADDDKCDPLSYATQPAMGASIGLGRNSNRTGTLGGYLELFKEGVVKQCGLTCAHVASIPTENGQEIFDGTDNSAPRVFHPSESDHNKAVDRIRATVRGQRLLEKRLQEKLENFGDSNPKTKETLEKVRSNIATWENAIDASISSDVNNREVGTVSASSVIRVLPENLPGGGCRMDWGLVEIKTERVGTNMYPSQDGEQIVMVDAPWEELSVSKVGRTTKKTEGHINPVQSCIRFDGIGNESRSMEWAIVADDAQSSFSREGDSGAFIIQDIGSLSVVGLLWGGLYDGMSTNKTYFTPIEVVARDILKATGYHVRLPGGEHICC